MYSQVLQKVNRKLLYIITAHNLAAALVFSYIKKKILTSNKKIEVLYLR